MTQEKTMNMTTMPSMQQPKVLSKSILQVGPNEYMYLNEKDSQTEPWKRAVRCDATGEIVYVWSNKHSVGAPRAYVETPEGKRPVGWGFTRPEVFLKTSRDQRSAEQKAEAVSLYRRALDIQAQALAERAKGA
jgi:hypothetical protein